MEIKDCKVGMKVLFGRQNGETTLGEITKVNGVKCKVKQLESRGTMKAYPVGTIWTVPASLMVPTVTSPGGWQAAVTPNPNITFVGGIPAAKRPDAEIMNDIASYYGQLSPENLYCDGEISRSAGQRRATVINARLRELFTEIGRKVSEDEAYGMPMDRSAMDKQMEFVNNLYRSNACRGWPFKRGDKVCFTVSKTGEVVVGYVRTLNVKTVTVDPIGNTTGRYWKVGPSLLRAA